MARHKNDYCEKKGDVLLDDREKAKASWLEVGGVFVHCDGDMQKVVAELQKLGVIPDKKNPTAGQLTQCASCNRIHCTDCLAQWLATNITCPFCKEPYQPQPADLSILNSKKFNCLTCPATFEYGQGH